MKAKVPKKLVLSIGLIVKNEEHNLGNCLEALNPLRAAIPSELIIVDTGSDDGTVELAKKYTDKVFHFDWIDDFAAARNFGLDMARGEWFLYLDADEWCESVDDMIRFFSRPQKVDFATLKIRSYAGNLTDYQDFRPTRIFRRTPGRRFTGPIHEYVFQSGDAAMLEDTVRHMGYSNRETYLKKIQERNIPMLERLIADGNPIPRDYFQLGKEYMQLRDKDRALSAYRTGIELEKTIPNNGIRFALYHDYVNALAVLGEEQEAIDVGEAYLAEKEFTTAGDLDVHYHLARLHLKKNQFEAVLEHTRRYFALMGGMEDGSTNQADLSATTLVYQTSESYRMMREEEIIAYRRLGQFEALLEAAETIDLFQGMRNREFLIGSVAAACCETENHTRLTGLYGEILQHAQRQALAEVFQKEVDAACKRNGDRLPALCGAFAEAFPEDPYVLLLQLREADRQETPDLPLLSRAMGTAPAEQRYAELFQYALKWGAGLEPFAGRIQADDAGLFTGYLRDRWDDYDLTICRYYLARPPADTPVARFWEACLCEQAVLMGRAVEGEQGDALFERMCRALGAHVCALYQPEVLDDPDNLLIPRAHRFGYTVLRAFDAKERGDITEYLRLLAEGAKIYPLMLPAVSVVANRKKQELERRREQEQNVETERAMLYLQIRERIRQLIGMNETEAAAQILNEYEKLNPKDDVIQYFRQQINGPAVPS